MSSVCQTTGLDGNVVLLAQSQWCLLQNDLACRLSCWSDEVEELVVQEANVSRNYRNAARYKKLVAWHTVLEKYRGPSTETTRGRRLRLWAQRATRWMAIHTRS
jgi:hypothetical protein